MSYKIKLERRGRLFIAALAPVAVILGGNAIEWTLENLKAAGVSEDTIIVTTLLTALSVIVFVALEQNAKPAKARKPKTKARKNKAKPQPSPHPAVDDDDD